MKTEFLWVILAVLLLSTCKDPYDIKTTENTTSLVIDGMITNNVGPYLLKLGVTSGVLYPPSALPGAKVMIYDNAGHQEAYIDRGKGNYECPGSLVQGTKGRKYFLDIVLPNGEHYQSDAETLPALQAKDSSWFQIEKITIVSSEGIPVERPVVNIYMSATLPSDEEHSYFRWTMNETYRLLPTCFPSIAMVCPPPCYITPPVTSSTLEILQTADFADKHLYNILLQSHDIDYTFLSKHYFNVSQFSMNINAYNYWKKVQELVQRTGSIFDTPPANLPGNIHNVNNPNEIVFGYFEASLQSINRVGIARGYIPGDIYSPCQYKPGFGTIYIPVCVNCSTAQGSTTIQPTWFQ